MAQYGKSCEPVDATQKKFGQPSPGRGMRHRGTSFCGIYLARLAAYRNRFWGTRAGCESEIASLDPFFGEAQKFCVPLLMVRGSHHGRGTHIYVDHLGPRDHDFKIFLVEPDCL